MVEKGGCKRGGKEGEKGCSSCVDKCVMIREMLIKPVFTMVLESGFMAKWDMKLRRKGAVYLVLDRERG